MRPGTFAVGLAICIYAVGLVWEFRPFAAPVHSWGVALVIALAGGLALYQAVAFVRSRVPAVRFAALAAFGAALAAAAELQAAFLIGPPSRISAAPGQLYTPSARSSVAVEFPQITTATMSAGEWPDSVAVKAGGKTETLAVDQTVRHGPYVFRAATGPVAFVSAATPAGRSVTVTQPVGATFASPFLMFPSASGDQPVDVFAVPALHRVARVAYYAGLPAHRINIPFLLVQISEENGGPLYQGVAVSGRPMRQAGMTVTFRIGTYPNVVMASAPAQFPFAIAGLMTIVGFAGFVWSVLGRGAA